jgi:hypothetical protein
MQMPRQWLQASLASIKVDRVVKKAVRLGAPVDLLNVWIRFWMNKEIVLFCRQSECGEGNQKVINPNVEGKTG